MPTGSLPYAEKPDQALSKDVLSSAAAADDVEVKGRDGNPREGRLPGMSPGHLQQPPGTPSLAADKKKRAEPSLENSTGLRKARQHGGAPGSPARGVSPPGPREPGQANRRHADRRRAEAANSVWARGLLPVPARPKGTALLGDHPFPDSGILESNDPNALHHFNRPGKAIPYKQPEPFARIPKPSWVTNRWWPGPVAPGVLREGEGRAARGSPRLGHNGVVPKGPCCPSGCVPVVGGDKDKACLSECRKEQDEVEAFCASEFGRWCPPQPTATEHLLSTGHFYF